jgi:hypothetical protein
MNKSLSYLEPSTSVEEEGKGEEVVGEHLSK